MENHDELLIKLDNVSKELNNLIFGISIFLEYWGKLPQSKKRYYNENRVYYKIIDIGRICQEDIDLIEDFKLVTTDLKERTIMMCCEWIKGESKLIKTRNKDLAKALKKIGVC